MSFLIPSGSKGRVGDWLLLIVKSGLNLGKEAALKAKLVLRLQVFTEPFLNIGELIVQKTQ